MTIFSSTRRIVTKNFCEMIDHHESGQKIFVSNQKMLRLTESGHIY